MNEELIVEKLLDHDDEFREIRETMATKVDINAIQSTLDKILTIVTKVRDDQVFTIEWIKRLQNQVDDQQKIIDFQAEEIRQIKLHLKLA